VKKLFEFTSHGATLLESQSWNFSTCTSTKELVQLYDGPLLDNLGRTDRASRTDTSTSCCKFTVILKAFAMSVSHSPLKRFVFPIPRFIFTAPPASPAFPKPPPLTELVTEEDNTEASTWLARFSGPQTKIPRQLVELTFSRSSGPGGQVCLTARDASASW
jgi:hypothetical protein